jgi:hypothetical protein
MKKTIKKEFLKKGYGQFPYIIIRQFPTMYLQIPLHDERQKNLKLDGIYISDMDRLQTKDFDEACKLRLHKLWSEQYKKGHPVDMCLVLNATIGYYISKEGKITEDSVPSGGILLSMDDSFIQINGDHFVMKRNDDQKKLSRIMKELKTMNYMRCWLP